MTTANVGIRSGNVIVPYVSATKRTKQLDISSALGCTQGFTAGQVGYAIFYADSAGNWRINFTMEGTLASAATSTSATITGVVFKNTVNQSVDAFGGGSPYYAGGSATANANSIYVQFSASGAALRLSGDLALNAEPTTYTLAANMEGAIAADVYIAPASASASGIVDTQAQSFKGPKTFIDGIVLGSGNETLSVYDEGTWTPGYNSSSNLLDSSGGTLSNTDITWGNSTYTRIGNRVFVTLATIAGLKINLINADTALVINATLLPTPNANAQLSGCASCYLPSPNYEKINVQISGNGSTITLNIQSHSPVEAGDILTLFGLSFTYFI